MQIDGFANTRRGAATREDRHAQLQCNAVARVRQTVNARAKCRCRGLVRLVLAGACDEVQGRVMTSPLECNLIARQLFVNTAGQQRQVLRQRHVDPTRFVTRVRRN